MATTKLTRFNGDLAEYTGKTTDVHGQRWYEIEMIEGHLIGETKVTPDAPAEFSEIQIKIRQHCKAGSFDHTQNVDHQISLFNFQCLIGMLETGEARPSDFDAVGGTSLVAQVCKSAQNLEDIRREGV